MRKKAERVKDIKMPTVQAQGRNRSISGSQEEPRMLIAGIRLKHIRLFKELNLQVLGSQRKGRKNTSFPRRKTIIIGENGTCKTTLLRCIVIGLCDQAWGNALLSEQGNTLLPPDGEIGHIEIDLQEAEGSGDIVTVETKIAKQNGKEQVVEKSGAFSNVNIPFTAAYGAGRAYELVNSESEYRIIDSTYTLFKYDTNLGNPELILRRLRDFLEPASFERILLGIRKAIGLTKKDNIEIKPEGGLTVVGPTIGAEIPIEAWADGYRLSLMWIVDLYGWALNARAITQNGGIRGIVLIDEIEQHLHPSMQASLLPSLANLMPEAQFFVMTHTPLVALGVTADEIVRLKRIGKFVKEFADTPDLTGWSVEDVLVHERYFATKPYAPHINRKLTEYDRLSSISPVRRTARQKARLAKLAQELKAQQLPLAEDDPLMMQLQKLRAELITE